VTLLVFGKLAGMHAHAEGDAFGHGKLLRFGLP
jgi:hypothetical protein